MEFSIGVKIRLKAVSNNERYSHMSVHIGKEGVIVKPPNSSGQKSVYHYVRFPGCPTAHRILPSEITVL